MPAITLLIAALIGYLLFGKDGGVTGLLVGTLVELICIALEPPKR